MQKLLIFGNSGSGKSTLARRRSEEGNLAHLDLDTIAWEPTNPPTRRDLRESAAAIAAFMEAHSGWVIEGCYADLLEMAAPHASEIIFLNLPVDDCVANARQRPWEPHKYDSKEAQDSNLEMLVDWIAQYPHRTDTFSLSAHERLYERFTGSKSMRTANLTS